MTKHFSFLTGNTRIEETPLIYLQTHSLTVKGLLQGTLATCTWRNLEKAMPYFRYQIIWSKKSSASSQAGGFGKTKHWVGTITQSFLRLSFTNSTQVPPKIDLLLNPTKSSFVLSSLQKALIIRLTTEVRIPTFLTDTSITCHGHL